MVNPEQLESHLQHLAPQRATLVREGLDHNVYSPEQALTMSDGHIDSQIKLAEIADHEVGHWVLGETAGMTITKITIEPVGNVLGSVQFASSTRSISEAETFITVAAGGEVAEERAGNNDHKGCGGDRFISRVYSNIIGRINRESPDSVMSRCRSKARSWFSSIPSHELKRRRWQLMRAGTIIK